MTGLQSCNKLNSSIGRGGKLNSSHLCIPCNETVNENIIECDIDYCVYTFSNHSQQCRIVSEDPETAGKE